MVMEIEIKKKVYVRKRNMGDKQNGDKEVEKKPSRMWCEG